MTYCKLKYYLRTFGEFQTWKMKSSVSMEALWHIQGSIDCFFIYIYIFLLISIYLTFVFCFVF